MNEENQDNETIRRAIHDSENPYFMMKRESAQDRKLSFEARGVLSYVLSKPNNWIVQIKDLQQKCGRDKVRRILRELIDAGYVEDRKPIRDEKTKQIIEYTPYIVHESPYNPDLFTEKPFAGEPSTENPTLHNIEVLDKKEKDLAPSAKSASKSPRKTPASDNAFELSKVIPKLLNLHFGREWNIAHMLSGTATKKGYKEYTAYFEGDNMVTPDELAKVVQYYRKQYPDAPIMQSPEIVADFVGKYRAYQAKRNEVPMFTHQQIWDFSDIDEQMGGGE